MFIYVYICLYICIYIYEMTYTKYTKKIKYINIH